MANVFGGGSNSSGSCGTNGTILQSPRQQVTPSRSVSSSPNVFNGESRTPGTADLRDFYTKREVDKYLDTKADISKIYERGVLYTKSEATIFIDTLGQAEVGVAYQGRIFICTIGNNLAATAKSYLNTACYLTEDNAARNASKK